MKHTYYHTCPYCGAHLDPGERCDCQKRLADTLTDGKAKSRPPCPAARHTQRAFAAAQAGTK